MIWKEHESGLIVPDRRVCSFGLGLDFGLGSKAGSAATGGDSSGPTLTIAASDDYTGHSDGSINGATLNNALGGSGTRTWGVLTSSAHAINYDTNLIRFTNPLAWRGAYINSYATTGTKHGMYIKGATIEATGRARFPIRTTSADSIFLWFELNDDAKPAIYAYDGSLDLDHELTTLDVHATGEKKDYYVFIDDKGADAITFYIVQDAKTETYEWTSGAAGYIGSAQPWFPGLHNYGDVSGDVTIDGFAVGTHDSTL